MSSQVMSIFSHPKVAKTFDWSVFAAGMASLVFAIAMTVITSETTEKADAALSSQLLTSL